MIVSRTEVSAKSRRMFGASAMAKSHASLNHHSVSWLAKWAKRAAYELFGLRALPVAPRQIPYHAGYTYFELDTRNNDLWRQLDQSGGLAMHIAGEFPGLELAFWAIRT